MVKIEAGFTGERFIVVPQTFLDLMQDNPVTGDLYVHSFGHIAHARHHYVSRPGGIDRHVFLYCTWGQGTIEVEGRSQRFSAHQFVILPAGMPHTYYADDNDPWTLYWVVFAGCKSDIFARSLEDPVFAPPSIHSPQEVRTALFEEMYSILCGGFSIEKLNYANIIMLHFLASFVYIDLYSKANAAVKHAEGMVSRVTHFMSENVESNLTLGDIASFAGYSKSYFYRKFYKETGYAPIDYFIHLKMNKASVYLIKTSMSISQIALKLGFLSPDYFSRTFRRIVGITASDFRKQNFRL